MSIDIKENKSSAKSRYRPEIDGLRAFAVVAVIINKAFQFYSIEARYVMLLIS